ncbi:hypothetical protein WMY93_031357, partial [Mugilogobius chulae]
ANLAARRRAPGESLDVFAADIGKLVQEAFPNYGTAAQKEEKFRRFLAGLDPCLRAKCQEQGATDLDEALVIAARCDMARETLRNDYTYPLGDTATNKPAPALVQSISEGASWQRTMDKARPPYQTNVSVNVGVKAANPCVPGWSREGVHRIPAGNGVVEKGTPGLTAAQHHHTTIVLFLQEDTARDHPEELSMRNQLSDGDPTYEPHPGKPSDKRGHTPRGVFSIDQGDIVTLPAAGESATVSVVSNEVPPVTLTDTPASALQIQQLNALLVEYVDIFSTTKAVTGKCTLVKHHINTGDHPPLRQRAYRASPDKREEIDRQVAALLADGVIEESCSPWASPVVLVKKKNGEWRFCIDYRRLNSVTVRDSHPLPRVDDTLDALSRLCWFSTLDFSHGYWQIDVAEEDRPKTAFNTGRGLYQWRSMPMGLTNSPATFQRMMELVLRGLPWQAAAGSKEHREGQVMAHAEVAYRGLRGMSIDKDPSGKRARWILELDPYNWILQHKDGHSHTNADSLSRRPDRSAGDTAAVINVVESSPAPPCDNISESAAPQPTAPVSGGQRLRTLLDDRDFLAMQQQSDPDISVVLDWITVGGSRPLREKLRGCSRRLRKLWSEFPRLSLLDGLLYRTVYSAPMGTVLRQVVVPISLVPEILHHLHGGPVSAHFSAERVWERARALCYWPSMLTDIRQWCEQCLPCQTRKAPTSKHRAPMGGLQTVRPFQRVAMDILELPVTSKGNRYVLVVEDYFSKFVNLYAMPNQTAQTVAQCLFDDYVIVHGVPETVHSDQGRQFEADVVQKLCVLLDMS